MCCRERRCDHQRTRLTCEGLVVIPGTRTRNLSNQLTKLKETLPSSDMFDFISLKSFLTAKSGGKKSFSVLSAGFAVRRVVLAST